MFVMVQDNAGMVKMRKTAVRILINIQLITMKKSAVIVAIQKLVCILTHQIGGNRKQ